jgi:type VI secretion system protein ImpB
MSESLQHKLDRVRRPRVQITYDVETGGAMEKKELPFVVGVMADLSGQPAEALKPMKERKFVPVDRDNFNEVLAKSHPRLAMRVPNRLANDNTEISGEFTFKSMDDFSPANVAEQVPALKKLLDVRHKLRQVLSKMEGNDELTDLLTRVLTNKEDAKSVADELGVQPEEAPAKA